MSLRVEHQDRVAGHREPRRIPFHRESSREAVRAGGRFHARRGRREIEHRHRIVVRFRHEEPRAARRKHERVRRASLARAGRRGIMQLRDDLASARIHDRDAVGGGRRHIQSRAIIAEDQGGWVTAGRDRARRRERAARPRGEHGHRVAVPRRGVHRTVRRDRDAVRVPARGEPLQHALRRDVEHRDRIGEILHGVDDPPITRPREPRRIARSARSAIRREHNAVAQRRDARVPREQIDRIGVPARRRQRVAVRREGESEERAWQWNRGRHAAVAPVDDLDSALLPAVQEQHGVAAIGGEHHRQRQRARLHRGRDRIEIIAGGQPVLGVVHRSRRARGRRRLAARREHDRHAGGRERSRDAIHSASGDAVKCRRGDSVLS